MSDRTKFLIVLGVVILGVVIGAVFPFAVDNTKRMKDAVKEAERMQQEQQQTVPAQKP